MMSRRICGATLILLAVLLAVASPALAAPASNTASVTIHVTGSDGIAIPGAVVDVLVLKAGAYRPSATLTTDANGNASITLKPGDYRFDVSAASADPGSVFLAAARGGVYTLDVVLASYGAISGAVLDAATGLPIAGAQVGLTRRNSDGTWPSAPTSTLVAADGTYATGAIPAGTYRVAASASGYASGFYDSSGLGQPSSIVVNRASTVTGIDVRLAAQVQSGRITGSVVSGAARTPMYQAIVFFYRQNADGTWPATSPGWGSPTRTVETGSLGEYDSGDLSLGNYRVRFFTVHTGSQWWQYQPTVSTATTVTIDAAGQVVSGIEGWFNKP